MPGFTKDDIERLSLTAAKRFLGGENKTPKDALVKTVSEYSDLTTEQIKRIVETTNTNIFRSLIATQREKTIGFPTINAEEIIESYGKAKEVEIIPPNGDYEKEPVELISPKPPEPEITIDPNKNIIEGEPSDKVKAAETYNRCLEAEEWLTGELGKTAMYLKGKEHELFNTLHQFLLYEDNSVGQMNKFAETTSDLIPYLREVLLDMNRKGELFMLKAPEKMAEEEKDMELDEDHPIIKLMHDIQELKQSIDSMSQTIEPLSVKKTLALRMASR